MLDSVKVTLPDQGTIPLNAVASVTIKQNTLFVEVWDTDVSIRPISHLAGQLTLEASKHVESAIHKANLPGLTPQKMGANTLKIPVPRFVSSFFTVRDSTTNA
jgi:ribosome recycling factor